MSSLDKVMAAVTRANTARAGAMSHGETGRGLPLHRQLPAHMQVGIAQGVAGKRGSAAQTLPESIFCRRPS
jgi:hypothetical protein